jgi:N-acetylneuraminic acid mutarotase
MRKIFYIIGLSLFSNIAISQTQNYWTKKSDFTGLKRERAVSFSINGKGYIGTGVDTTDLVQNDLWEYDPTLDSWTQKADLIGSARRNAIGFAINGKGYIGTGMNHSSASFGNTLSDFSQYDPILNTWISKASFPGSAGGGIYFATGCSADSKGYLCGGKRGPNNYTAEFWEYKPTTDTWIQRQDFPGGVRYQLCSFTIDNLAYIGLGIDQDVYRKDIWQYNPSTGIWTQKNDFLGGERGAVSTFSLGQRGFICLGSDGGFKGDLWEYNPFSDAWSIRSNFGGSERKNAISFTIGDSAFVGTGKGVSGKKMSMYVYTPYAILSTGDKLNTNYINIYPNPIDDAININLDDNIITALTLINMSGKIILNQEVESSQFKIDRNNEPSGIYLLILQDENNTIVQTKKLIFK